MKSAEHQAVPVTASVQTSEHAAGTDLFGEPMEIAAPDLPAVSCTMTYTGRLAHKPHTANRTDRKGRMAPVLVLELDEVGAGRHQVVAHIPFTEETRAEFERYARELRRDQVVTVTTSLSDVRLFLPLADLSSHHQPH